MTQPDRDNPVTGLDREIAPPEPLEARVRRTLRARGLLAGRGTRWRPLLAVAAAVTLMLGGYAVGKRAAPVPAGPGAGRYVLLLYEDADFDTGRPEAEVVAEYSSWAARLRERGQLESGEKLEDRLVELQPGPDAAVAVVRGAPGGSDIVGGFFIINAADEAEALTIARSCPHLKYGGRVMVRALAQT
jgi:hypothetical protein